MLATPPNGGARHRCLRSPATASSAAEVDLSTLLSTADGFAKAGKDLYFTVAQSLYRWAEGKSASFIAQGVDGRLVGDTNALMHLTSGVAR